MRWVDLHHCFGRYGQNLKIYGAMVFVNILQSVEMCHEKFSTCDFGLIHHGVMSSVHLYHIQRCAAIFHYSANSNNHQTAHFIERLTSKFLECDGSSSTFLSANNAMEKNTPGGFQEAGGANHNSTKRN